MRDDELDVLLSSLTSVEPEPRLRERVVRAIESREVSSELDMPPRWRGVAVLGAVAVLLLAIGLTWRAARVGPWPQAANAPVLAVAGAIEPAPLPDEAWGRTSVLPQRIGGRATRRIPGEDPWPYRLPPLEPSAPLALVRLERETIDHQELGVEPLSIAQLEIESLER